MELESGYNRWCYTDVQSLLQPSRLNFYGNRPALLHPRALPLASQTFTENSFQTLRVKAVLMETLGIAEVPKMSFVLWRSRRPCLLYQHLNTGRRSGFSRPKSPLKDADTSLSPHPLGGCSTKARQVVGLAGSSADFPVRGRQIKPSPTRAGDVRRPRRPSPRRSLSGKSRKFENQFVW